MAALNETTHSAFGHGFSDVISHAAYRIVTKVTNWNDNRQTRNTLNRLSDHQLEDIGMTRGDITFYR